MLIEIRFLAFLANNLNIGIVLEIAKGASKPQAVVSSVYWFGYLGEN